MRENIPSPILTSFTPLSNTTPPPRILTLNSQEGAIFLTGTSKSLYLLAKLSNSIVYPPMMNTEKIGDAYVITGSVAENENLAVEILSNADGFNQIQGYRNKVGNVRESTSWAAFWYNLTYYVAYFLNYCAKIAVISVPFLLLAIYHWYGREKSFTVPEYLSTIPNPAMKPWQVNLLFKGDALDFDEDGYYASLLDLHRRKIISITEKGEGKGIEIRVLSGATTDPYEQRVLGFVDLVSENSVLDTSRIEALAIRAKTNTSAEETALKYQRSLTDVTHRVDTSIISTVYS